MAVQKSINVGSFYSYCALGLVFAGESSSAAAGQANFTPLIRSLLRWSNPTRIFFTKDQTGWMPRLLRTRFLIYTPSRLGSARSGLSVVIFTTAKRGPLAAFGMLEKASSAS